MGAAALAALGLRAATGRRPAIAFSRGRRVKRLQQVTARLTLRLVPAIWDTHIQHTLHPSPPGEGLRVREVLFFYHIFEQQRAHDQIDNVDDAENLRPRDPRVRRRVDP